MLEQFSKNLTAFQQLKKIRSDRRGFVLPTAAVFFIVSLPVVGLVIDVGLDYLIQTKLQMAIDAAALAGARSLSRGNDDGTQQTNAENTAEAYLAANFPSGYLGVSSPKVTNIGVTESGTNVRSVSITATATMPVSFMGWFGSGSTVVGATATASRRDVNIMIVMDRSGSLANSGSCTPLKAAASGFVSKFANGRDNLGLITFATSSKTDFGLADNFATASPAVVDIINSVTCIGATSSAQALWQGYQALATLAQPAALNVIVFFTDGQPTAVTGVMPKAGSNCKNAGPFQGVYTVGFQTTTPFSPVATGGIFYWVANSQPQPTDSTFISTTNGGVDTTGCAFLSSWTSAYQDIVGFPTTDIWGNSLTTDISGGHQSVTTISSGGTNYVKTTSDVTGATNFINASTNAADNAATRIRAAASPGNGAAALSGVVIYSIGLGNSTYPANGGFLERVANDPASGPICTTCPEGKYYFAPSAADLSDAFANVASEILRLAK